MQLFAEVITIVQVGWPQAFHLKVPTRSDSVHQITFGVGIYTHIYG